jgi:hypothetical protein
MFGHAFFQFLPTRIYRDQSAEHVLGFLKALRAELAFYLGRLNLKEQLGRC